MKVLFSCMLLYIVLVIKSRLPPNSHHLEIDASIIGNRINKQADVAESSKVIHDKIGSDSVLNRGMRNSESGFMNELVTEVAKLEAILPTSEINDSLHSPGEHLVHNRQESALKELNGCIDEIDTLISSMQSSKQSIGTSKSTCAACENLRKENENLKMELIQLRTSVPVFRSPDASSSIPSVHLASDRLRSISASLSKALDRKRTI